MYCPNCGKENNIDNDFCIHCSEKIGIYRNEDTKKRFEANYNIEDGEFELASLRRRIGAYLIDAIVLSIIAVIIVVFSLVIQYIYFNPDDVQIYLILIILFVPLYYGYFFLMEGLFNGRTIGKMVLGLRVVREKDQSRIGFKKSAIRNLLRMIDEFFWYLVGVLLIHGSDKNQRLGDSVAHTIVIKKRKKY
ncbi:MAG: RDD family protein [Methanobacterium sp.]|uniref:RDD family protein n=1 Tax=Methanobacterium sp. TaxID=2164 RepID=UPI003D65B5CB|nr:RDD family protein [Methanobacterium sp.]